MKKCPYCGYENKDNAEVCIHCFAELPQKAEQKQEEQKPVRKKK